ncbi:tail fiber domain-containing protein [Flavobacterium sp.]|uniref:tail fiber domain-containing protein n=1 Tax=Flavobacterium sp. TaxID=239 RepID=UPI0025F93D4A|nr:tail fiber domain-containing protein [Flavobacterium sp.]
MANSLLIEKQTGGYFKFTLNGDSDNAITSIKNDLLAVGDELHFKTGNGANIIKEQSIHPEDITIISGGTFTFTTVAQVWNKLIDIDYFAWLGNGSGGIVDRFSELIDTFQYVGNAGKAIVVDNSELKLIPIELHNINSFTELTDTPSALVPNKMVVVNSEGTALELQDQPSTPEQFLNSVGYFDYNDLVTQTTPLTAVTNVALKLTNDTAGDNTNTSQNPYGVSYVWDTITNQFNFSELSIGDTIDVRIHVQVTTTTNNQKVGLSAKLGIGSVAEFTNSIFSGQFKTAGVQEISFVAPFYMGSSYITDYPAELYLTTDASASVKVKGWYVRILRKNINIITVDYSVPDATSSVKGVIRLGGDLSGTANTPTVPGLATKVPTSRTIGTTSPLLGGGALTSDLILGIQQANSTDSGYLSSTDWTHFNDTYNDKVVSISVSGTTTKTLTITQQDGGTLTTSWTDNNSITSVFGRTGDIVATNGDYTTSQVTEGSNLYFTNSRVSANTDVAANTSARHNAVTIGTANGLSLSTQALSLGLASTSTNGALSSTDWNTFNNKANDANVVKLTGNQSIDGIKTFIANSTVFDPSGTTSILTFKGSGALVAEFSFNSSFTQFSSRASGGYLFKNTASANALTIADNGNGVFLGNLTSTAFIRSGGTSAQFLKADGSVDSTSYISLSSLSGTAPISYNNSTGAISISQANTSTNGYLSSTDWNTFNNKQNALTNPITGTGTTNYHAKFTGSGTLGNSLIYDNGTNVGIGTTSPSEKLEVQSGAAGAKIKVSNSGGGYATLECSSNASSVAQLSFTNQLSLIGGNVGIGTTSPNYKLSVLSANNVSWLEDTSGASGATFILFSAPGNTGIGSISRVGTTSAIAYNSTSDYRLKEDLKPINGLEKISKIKVYDFKWKNHTDRMDGVIAHELQEIVPYAVTGEKDAEQMQSVDYSKLVPILVQAIQELKAEIEILKNK